MLNNIRGQPASLNSKINAKEARLVNPAALTA